MSKTLIMIFISISLLIFACSAVPTTRYETKQKTEEIKEEKKEEIKKIEKSNVRNILNEDYDVKRFSPDLNYNKKDTEKSETIVDKEIWYSFPTTAETNPSSNTRKISSTAEGFRILVFSSDDLEELNEVQTRLEEARGIHQIYSIFEPPFYKLYIGDFILLDDANSLRRKLIQLDFKESKVIRTTINLFQ
jgi:hypothetical protein